MWESESHAEPESDSQRASRVTELSQTLNVMRPIKIKLLLLQLLLMWIPTVLCWAGCVWKWVGEGVLVHFLLLCISGNDKKSINGSWWWRGGGRDVGRRSLHTAQIEKGNFVWSRHLYAPCYISIPVPSSASYQCWLRLNSLLGLSCCALSLLLCFSLAYLLFACWVLLLLCFICYLLFVAVVFYFYVAARFIYTHP